MPQAEQTKVTNPRDFTQGPVHRHLVRLSGFMLMGLASVMGAQLAETIYLGRLGTAELAALGFTFPLVMVLQGVTMGLSVGASSVVARSVGEGDWERARTLITHCFVFVILLIILLAIVTYHLTTPFFTLLGADATVLPLATQYMSLWLWGLPFFSVAMIASTLMRAAGDASTPGYLMTIGSGLQILLGPVFIFGLYGAPRLEVEGAVVAFILARSVSLMMYGYCVLVRDRLVNMQMAGFFLSCRDILHVGLPATASNLITPVSMSVFTWLLAAHGAAVVAGFSLASRIETMLMMLVIALSVSIGPFVGQNWGAGLYDRVWQSLRQANSFALLWGVIAYGLLAASGAWLVSLVNDDPLVVSVGATYLLIAPLGIGVMGILQNSTSVFNALGNPMPALVLSLLQMLVIGIPMAFLGDHLFGYAGVFAAGMVTVLLLGAVSWFWLRRNIAIAIAARTA